MDDIQELKRLEQELKIKEGLPHLFGINPYQWQKDYLETDNRDSFICAANQIGKSSIQIIKAIHWATEPSLWSRFWVGKPRAFWYLYPSLKMASDEFKEKWVKEFLPRNGFENDAQYGYKIDVRQKMIHSIDFNTGVTIYFKSYSQDAADLQAGTVAAVFCDEELPYSLYPELQARLRSTRGYFSMVFTATLGQDEWRCTIEGRGKEEKFVGAFKRQVSMYDCQKFHDGQSSKWTTQRIAEEIKRCATEVEVQRRIRGRFVVEGGLIYSGFVRRRNVVEKTHKLPREWHIYAGVDIGSGGEHGHPAAIVFVAVSPKFNNARVFKAWRGDGVTTTAMDIVKKYQRMKGNMTITGAYYDWASADFYTVATRIGEAFSKADKKKEAGRDIMNTLFKNRMLKIYDEGDELRKLVNELVSLKLNKSKTNAKDDLCDALKYACASVPWDFSNLPSPPKSHGKPRILPDKREMLRMRQLAGERTQDIEAQMKTFVDEDDSGFWEDYINFDTEEYE